MSELLGSGTRDRRAGRTRGRERSVPVQGCCSRLRRSAKSATRAPAALAWHTRAPDSRGTTLRHVRPQKRHSMTATLAGSPHDPCGRTELPRARMRWFTRRNHGGRFRDGSRGRSLCARARRAVVVLRAFHFRVLQPTYAHDGLPDGRETPPGRLWRSSGPKKRHAGLQPANLLGRDAEPKKSVLARRGQSRGQEGLLLQEVVSQRHLHGKGTRQKLVETGDSQTYNRHGMCCITN